MVDVLAYLVKVLHEELHCFRLPHAFVHGDCRTHPVKLLSQLGRQSFLHGANIIHQVCLYFSIVRLPPVAHGKCKVIARQLLHYALKLALLICPQVFNTVRG